MKKGSWPKPSAAMIELLAKHADGLPAEKRQMFGCPCYFVNGNMFAGVFADHIFARLSGTDRDRLDKKGLGADFEPVKGRKMAEYRTLGQTIIDDPEELDVWLARSLAYASSLRPKKNG